ncbi:hypothetical protein ASG32_09590 [Methylobacterium sp. Leaf361]|uniref:hypothetical protein n=1 Tax=unclassified Methylobacterium TaxID=2615210 RepID=UPI00070004EC|nr:MULTISPECIES: hypothetical protein [unclassified Methylobacterium]KQS69669.1 hypothetical protein ASG32_09590 [Methylobacterium sp. Leaf361]SFS91188.1 hypothetical protein SAMN04487845_109167 [Methylobacterium sp. yr668]
MSGTAKKTDPKLWDKVKTQVTKSEKGGKPGQWSARKAQIATAEYKKEGGGYAGKKSADNHLQQWTDEEWGTKSGKESGKTGERYLPKKARESLTDTEYAASTAKKRADTRKGKQFSKQPKAAAEKAAAAREDGKSTKASGKGKTSGKTTGKSAAKASGKASGKVETTKAALMRKARAQNVPGRSRMSKAQLEHAVHA